MLVRLMKKTDYLYKFYFGMKVAEILAIRGE